MKISCVCPACGWRVSRAKCIEDKAIRCAQCGIMIKSAGFKVTNALAGVMLVMFFAVWASYRFWKLIDLPTFLGCAALVILIVWLTLPYTIRFLQVSHGPVCRKCEYELYGCRGETCPECGEAIDVPLK